MTPLQPGYARIALKLGGLAFAVLLDVSVSIFIAHSIALYSERALLWWHYVIIAPLIGVSPDFDAGFQFFSKRKVDDAHHSFLHVPPLMICVGLFGGYVLFSIFWGNVIALSLFCHYFHDSCMQDFGLKWLWPFTNNQYHFFGWKQLGKSWRDDRKKKIQFVISYTPAELAKLEQEGAFIDLDTWLREIYYRPSHYAVIEFSLAMALLFFVARTK